MKTLYIKKLNYVSKNDFIPALSIYKKYAQKKMESESGVFFFSSLNNDIIFNLDLSLYDSYASKERKLYIGVNDLRDISPKIKLIPQGDLLTWLFIPCKKFLGITRLIYYDMIKLLFDRERITLNENTIYLDGFEICNVEESLINDFLVVEVIVHTKFIQNILGLEQFVDFLIKDIRGFLYIF